MTEKKKIKDVADIFDEDSKLVITPNYKEVGTGINCSASCKGEIVEEFFRSCEGNSSPLNPVHLPIFKGEEWLSGDFHCEKCGNIYNKDVIRNLMDEKKKN